MHQTQHIHDDMLIGDILSMLPDSAQIMEDFGLHCTSCSINAFEPIKLGAMSHGLSEEVVDDMIKQINNMAIARENRIPKDSILVTPRAAKKIQEFAKAEDKKGYGLRITANNNEGREPAYGMDFEEKAAKGDKTFEFEGTEIYLDKESMKNMGGAEIDFLETQYGSGFKINNPQFMNKGGCGGACNDGCGS